MLKTVILAENPLEPETWERFEVEDVCEFLSGRFSEWPATGRIYHNQVAECNDVTPNNEAGIEKLQSLDGTLYCVIYPADPVVVIAVVALIAVVAVTFLMAPKISVPSAIARDQRNRQSKSPNNELSDRKNAPRLNGRIPDIFGQVRSTPDLIAVPYTVFDNHQEVEHTYMCVGRGEYDIESIRDDTTLVTDIAGTSVEIYAPYTSPNSGDAPQLQIGTDINTPLYNIFRSNSVNGQVLRPPNDVNVVGNSDIKFSAPNEIISNVGSLDMTDKFEAGDSLIVTNAQTSITYTDDVTDPLNPVEVTVDFDFDGTYTVLAVSNDTVILSDPASVNTAWDDLSALSTYGVTETGYFSPTLATSGPKWIGPFTLDYASLEKVFVNVVAANGLFKDDGYTQTRTDVTVELELTPIDANGDPTGPEETFQITIEGSATLTSSRAGTIQASPTFTGPCKARMRRVSETDLNYNGNVVDEVKWRDLYSVSDVNKTDFGNVTTVQVVTYATAGALTIKERKLNMLATRRIPLRISGSTFTTSLTATTRADEIISAICLDNYIGNRNVSEIDFDSIYDTIAAVETYFGTALAVGFNYTFDSDNLSFEETIASICNAVFCVAYRRGNVIKLSFEKETEDSTLLFNHRNKMPGSETRTVSFGYTNDNDGIEFEYTSPDDDAVVTYYLPEDQSAVNPKKIESVGIRSKVQAHFHAWRAWNKIRYQNASGEFEALQEADLLVLQDRILVADNTRPDTQDGEILEQNGLALTTSQPTTFADGISYVVFLQLSDGTVESISVVAGSNEYEIVLSQAPRLPLVVEAAASVRTTYMLVGNNDVRISAFLVGEKNPRDRFTTIVTASNYDARYYEHDSDFINSLIAE